MKLMRLGFDTLVQLRHLAIICIAVLLLSGISPAEKAASADAFVDSIGVNIHLHHFNTAYSNFPQVESALKDLHVRHVRDGLIDTTWKDYYSRHNELGRNGIKGLFITSANQSEDLLAGFPARVKDSFEAYEAPNEYDQSGDGNWVSTLGNFMEKLSTIKKDPRTSKFPVIGPSLTKASSFAKLQGDCTFDYSNLHNYFSGRNPGTGGWGSNGYGSIVWNLGEVNSDCPGKPVITTETGYQTISSISNSVPETVAAKYVPRVFLEQWLHGVRRTYLYELIDLPQGNSSKDNGFGLLRPDFSHKPAFDVLANLTGLLSDPGPSFVPSDLSFQFSGDVSNLHHVLLQRRNGNFFLVLWLEESCYDVDAKKSIAIRPRQVTIHTPNAMSALLYEFDSAGKMKSHELEKSLSYSMDISDLISILELGPRPPAPVMNPPTITPR
jgi:hypothetical protein